MIGPPQEGYEAPDRRRLWWVRVLSLLAGSVALVFAMVVFPDQRRARDWSWTVGVALLVLSLVANRLIARLSPPR